MPIPADWRNPITAAVSHLQSSVTPADLLPGRGDLIRARVDAQRQLIRSGVRRLTPVRVTPDGVIIDGHHMVRAAAEEGKLIEVQVVGLSQPPSGEMIRDLPVR